MSTRTRSLATIVGLLAMAPAVAGAQLPGVTVEALYADVRAKEKAVQVALADPDAAPAVVKAVRTVVADYEALVRSYPASAYSDDALWFAGWLSIAGFERFGNEHERGAAMRLWRLLAAEYPSSKLAKQVPQHLARVEQAGPGRPSDTDRALPAEARSGASPADERRRSAPSLRVEPAAALSRPPANERSPLAALTAIHRTVLPEGVRLTIELDREVPFRDQQLVDPPRVFVDLSSTTASPDLRERTIRYDGDADLVRQVRVGHHPNNTTRVVLDLAALVSYNVYPLYSPYRLIIECLRENEAQVRRQAASMTKPASRAVPSAPRVPALPARPSGPLFVAGLMTPPAGFAVLDRASSTLPSRPVTPAAIPTMPPARNVGGGFSIARQLGLRVSRIVIDAGHGGHDPGATGKGVTEAALVLDIALRLEERLKEVPGVNVVLTRRTDEFVGLQERTAIANREGADLFLSIHANASSNLQTQGVETYFLNFATTSSAAAVAARENASSGQAMAALPDLVKAITLHNKLDESRDFATYVQRALVERLRPLNRNLKNLGVKQAPFVVLIGAAMPSVLVEISFLTNAEEVRLIRGSAYRQRIAEALFNAIRQYQVSLKTETRSTQD